MGDKPFFVYFAPGATHAPHHVPKEWADRYRGRFDQGWDRLREETIQRQKALGVIPADTELTARHAEIPAWDDMPDDLEPVLIRQMEVYAGFLEYADHHVGRLIDALADLGILGDTLVYYIVGDNGASAEGTLNGTFNEMINFNGAAAIETPEFMTERLDDFGGPDSYNHYAVGWAHAMDTPYQWTKQVASHCGAWRCWWRCSLAGGCGSGRRARRGSGGGGRTRRLGGVLRGLNGEAAAVADALAGATTMPVRALLCVHGWTRPAAGWSVQEVQVATLSRLADVVREGPRVGRGEVDQAVVRALEVLRPAV
jgi:Sulfatase